MRVQIKADPSLRTNENRRESSPDDSCSIDKFRNTLTTVGCAEEWQCTIAGSSGKFASAKGLRVEILAIDRAT
jgi:hypothetical protein